MSLVISSQFLGSTAEGIQNVTLSYNTCGCRSCPRLRWRGQTKFSDAGGPRESDANRTAFNAVGMGGREDTSSSCPKKCPQLQSSPPARYHPISFTRFWSQIRIGKVPLKHQLIMWVLGLDRNPRPATASQAIVHLEDKSKSARLVTGSLFLSPGAACDLIWVLVSG